jgi:hypothetical protein
MDSVIQQGRDPEWRLAFGDRLDEAARARVRSAVKNGESVDEPNQASIAAGLARREQRRVLLLGLVLLPVQLGVAVFWVRLFVTGRLPAVFGWFWIAVLVGYVKAFMQLAGTREGVRRAGRVDARRLGHPGRGQSTGRTGLVAAARAPGGDGGAL